MSCSANTYLKNLQILFFRDPEDEEKILLKEWMLRCVSYAWFNDTDLCN
jgi:hypothetical protein